MTKRYGLVIIGPNEVYLPPSALIRAKSVADEIKSGSVVYATRKSNMFSSGKGLEDSLNQHALPSLGIRILVEEVNVPSHINDIGRKIYLHADDLDTFQDLRFGRRRLIQMRAVPLENQYFQNLLEEEEGDLK